MDKDEHKPLHGHIVDGPVPDDVSTAVALHYDGNHAPHVTAKGHGDIAKRIYEIAQQHNVPLHEDADLSALLSRLDLGEEIPRELYIAIAEIIAFAYLISGKASEYTQDR